MIPTIPYIERKFEEFNRLMFDGKLPPIPIVLSNAKTFLGQFTYKKRVGKNGKTEYFDFKMRINTRADLPEQEVEDTLIHEMIHYYIRVNNLNDTSTHGRLFKLIMNTINQRFGRHISVSFRGTKEQHEQLADKRKRYHVVALVRFSDGRVGVKVLPRVVQSILKYYNSVLRARGVESVSLFMSNNIFFNRFPNSSALKVHYVDEAEVLDCLKGAESLPCDGKSIKRTR